MERHASESVSIRKTPPGLVHDSLARGTEESEHLKASAHPLEHRDLRHSVSDIGAKINYVRYVQVLEAKVYVQEHFVAVEVLVYFVSRVARFWPKLLTVFCISVYSVSRGIAISPMSYM